MNRLAIFGLFVLLICLFKFLLCKFLLIERFSDLTCVYDFLFSYPVKLFLLCFGSFMLSILKSKLIFREDSV